MIMFDQALVSICALKYLESYLDCMENLPEDIQRVISHVMELDIQSQDLVSSFPESDDIVVSSKDEIVKIQKQLVQLQEVIDEKLNCVSQIQETIDQKMQVLEDGRDNHEDAKKQKLSLPEKQPRQSILPPAAPPVPATTTAPATTTTTTSHTRSNSVSSNTASKTSLPPANSTNHKTNNVKQAAATTVVTPARESTSATTPVSENKPGKKRLQRGKIEEEVRPERAVAFKRSLDDSSEDSGSTKKKRKRKMGKQGGRGSQRGDEGGIVDHEIDPDEPTYCVCKNVSYGEMVCCDNDRCTIEWFHFNCVGLAAKPKGKWYCPNCRGDSAKVLRKDTSRK